MFCGARFFNQPLNQLPRLRATPGGSGAVTARLALTGTLITGNLPIITPRRGSTIKKLINKLSTNSINPVIQELLKEFNNVEDPRLAGAHAALEHTQAQGRF